MKVIFSHLAFDIGKEETLAPLLTKGWAVPTKENPESSKDFEGSKAVVKRIVEVGPGQDVAMFQITGTSLTDISIAYAGIICDLEDVGLLPKNN